jgi:hypothetical protein
MMAQGLHFTSLKSHRSLSPMNLLPLLAYVLAQSLFIAVTRYAMKQTGVYPAHCFFRTMQERFT